MSLNRERVTVFKGYAKALNDYIQKALEAAASAKSKKTYTAKQLQKQLGIQDGLLSNVDGIFNDGALKLYR